MRVLLDEMLPAKIAGLLPDHDVTTVNQARFTGLDNGKLINRAVTAGYTVLVTADQGLPKQRNIAVSDMALTYDEQADALSVQFRRRGVARTEELSDSVAVDYDADGRPLGVEFLNVSLGIDLDQVPRRAQVAKLLEERHFKVFA